MQEKEDKIRKWNTLIKQYIAHHKYLKDVGRKWISNGGSSHDVQLTLEEALLHADKTLHELKLYFAPYLTKNIFLEVRFKNELDQLMEETKQLKFENEQLKQSNEDYKKAIVKAEMIVFENRNLQERVECLEEVCNNMRPDDENFQSILKRKQEQFDDMLKVQNDLISNLKEQLAQSAKDKEMFRTLNKNLENELKKNTFYKEDMFHAGFGKRIEGDILIKEEMSNLHDDSTKSAPYPIPNYNI